MSNSSQNLLVFSGAGASKAVNKEKFPTTVEFFQRLPSFITDDVLFNIALEYIKNFEKIEDVDIEHILWSLKILSEFYGSITSPTDIVGFSINSGLNARVIPNSNDGNLPNVAPQLKQRVDLLISRINAIVYDLYAYEPDESEIENNWTLLFKVLKNSNCNFDVFSTNYDAVIECAFGVVYDEKENRIFQGTKGKQRRELDLKRWKEPSPETFGLLTKLHGSIDWKIQDNRIFIGDPVFTGNHEKQGIVYPGFKGRSNFPFFKEFHDYLELKISNATGLIFIGFAFRDEYINEIIRSNINSNANVVCINPDKSVKFPSNRQNKIRYVHDYFDISSIAAAHSFLGI